MLTDTQIEPIDLSPQLRAAAEAKDAAVLNALLDPLPYSEALRELLSLTPEERDVVLSLVSSDLAAQLIEEAPHEMGAELIERLETSRAVEILDELDSDIQADLLGDMEDKDAEAILSEMEAEDAADVRRLVEYEDDTAGGLMMSEVFKFADTQTVGNVL
ncbi:magnesium transporter MgtE N-terminal domain-containing protein, partial [Loktanella sp. S4079]|uniref:magnesium transporter MgtE N-terminal domain-containing protein n=1 Tax=Loktanella sp. S4079 TaxID=579483 RepID=UPI0005F9E77D